MSLTDEDKLWIAGLINGVAERVERRTDSLTQRVDSLSERVDTLSKRTDSLTERVDTLTQRVDGLTRYILEFRTEAIRRFDFLDQRTEFLLASVNNMDARFPPLNKAVSEFGLAGSQFIREQATVKEATGNLADRLARLEEQVAKLIQPAA